MKPRIHTRSGACNRPRQSSHAMRGSYRPPADAHDMRWHDRKPGIVDLPQDWPAVAFLALVALLSAVLGYVGLHGMGWL